MRTNFIKLTKNNDTFCHYAYGSNLTLAKSNASRKYMQRLAKCKDYAKVKDIYAGIANPMIDDLVQLYNLGYVARYTKPQYIKTHTYKSYDGQDVSYKAPTRVWWKATKKGLELLAKYGM